MTFFNRQREWYFYIEEILSLNNNLLINNDASLNGNLSGSNAYLSNNVNASWFNGNLSGTNASLSNNVRAQWFNGNLSGTNAYLSNNVTAQWFNGNLSGTNATLTENVRASWFNGNLSGTNATLTETLRANTIHVNELHLAPNTLYINNEPILYTHNGNLLMNVDHFHGDLTGNLISKNTFVNGNIIIGNNFGIKFNDGTTITSGNISSTSGGGGTSNVTPQEIDDRISNYLFNKPEPPTDSSHNFQIITDDTGTHPTITLKWSNPITKRVAFSFGTTPGYNTPLTSNFTNHFTSNKNITHLPYSRELKIQYREENTQHNSWANLTLNSDGTGNTHYTIPNTVITANLSLSDSIPTLIANTVTNTYTEFKSGRGLQIGNSYQFRIYLTNDLTEPDSSYNYLYIPSQTGYIAFGGFANVTAPTEISFPVNSYNELRIRGINESSYVETGMHTIFPIPENYNLRVRYGFDIDISANVSSKQMLDKRGNYKSGKFITDYLTSNTFTENISLVSSLTLTNGNIINWYPEFDYNVSNFFMEANLDILGNIAQTTIGNTITTVRPSRANIGAATIFFNDLSQQDYTPYFSNNDFGRTKSNIYRYGNDTSIDNIYILDSTQSFNLTFNPGIKVINNRDEFIGIDSSGNYLSQFRGKITINTSITPPIIYISYTNKTKGFLEVTDISVNHIIQSFNSSELIINGHVLDGANSDNLLSEGYYTDILLNELGVKNINLRAYPDICNNNYQKYKVNIENYSFSTTDDTSSIYPYSSSYKGTITFDFGVAKKSTNNITFNFNLDNFLNLTLNDKFYGIPRPNTSYSSDKPIIGFNYTFSDVNSFWRSNLNIIENINIKLLNSSITFTDTNNTKNWTTEIYNPGRLQFDRNIENTTWNIITNSTNNNYFSRSHGTNTQFNITFNVNNNIGFSNTLSHNEHFNWNKSNDVLWWDYTWGINNNIPSSVFIQKPSSLTIELCKSINPFTSGNTIPNLFNHDNKITYETAMWSKDGWCGANITSSDDYNPYIDYTQYNLITDISYNYSIFDNSGTQQTIKYGINVYTGNSSFQSLPFDNLKWVIFKLHNHVQNTKSLQFETNLTWLTHYIVFYLEEDYNNNSSSYTIFDTASISSSNTYWLDVQNTSVNSSAIMNFITGQNQTPVGSNNGCNAGDSGENMRIINRFRGGDSLINQYIAFGIKPGNKLKTITFSYV